MRRNGQRTGARPVAGFTLIELLVVVAIIALLISILLPSLSKARAQARTTLCASRIAQLTKSMIMYASDFDECPPFIGTGFEDPGDHEYYANLGAYADDLAREEKWLIPNMTLIWAETNWDGLVGTNLEPKPEQGTLFPFTRFANLYRCPEFERQQGKTQNVFNYTRSVLGRKLLSNVPFVDDAGAEDELHPGPVLKLSAAYAPAALYMMLDEQWDFHVAGKYNDPGCLPSMGGMWMQAETIHALAGDMIGSYHGTKGKVIQWPELYEGQKGNVGHYDGHVEAISDPWPWRQSSDGLGALLMRLGGDLEHGRKVLDPLLQSIYAQRGIAITDEFIAQLIAGLGG